MKKKRIKEGREFLFSDLATWVIIVGAWYLWDPYKVQEWFWVVLISFVGIVVYDGFIR